MLAALAGFVALQAAAYLNAGVFEYPLDDVYIHLAMASNIASGTYGVNAGEAASAASSILYPLLLLPFPDTEFQRLLPLFWNTLAVAGAGWVWGRIVVEAGLEGVIGAAVALAGPIGLNISGLGFTGMEASLHLLMSLIVVLGLWQALSGRVVSAGLVAAAIAAPLFRYEGLALTVLACVALFLFGYRRAAMVILAASLSVIAGFSLFLVSLGLSPLPNSVLAKTGASETPGDPAPGLIDSLIVNLTKPAGAILGVLVLLVAVALAVSPVLRRGAPGALLGAVGGAALAHLIFGKIGWMHRYEPYIVVSLVAAFLLAASTAGARERMVVQGVALATIGAAAIAYWPMLLTYYVWNPRAIHIQQAQMARFARDYVQAPVAVNDIGRVAWGNPSYVLDLWGLGSAEALAMRLAAEPPADGWAGPLAERHGVKVAMIYDAWLGPAVGADWARLGTLEMDPARGATGDKTVAIYAADPDYVPELHDRLMAFAKTLPDGASLKVDDVTMGLD